MHGVAAVFAPGPFMSLYDSICTADDVAAQPGGAKEARGAPWRGPGYP